MPASHPKHQFVRNEEIATRTGLPPLSTTICCRRSAIFGHLAKLGDEVPAYKALQIASGCLRDASQTPHKNVVPFVHVAGG